MAEETETVHVRFMPLQRATMELMLAVNEKEPDPVDSMNRLLSAALMSAAVLNLECDSLIDYVRIAYPNAILAVKERPDIFGGSDADA